MERWRWLATPWALGLLCWLGFREQAHDQLLIVGASTATTVLLAFGFFLYFLWRQPVDEARQRAREARDAKRALKKATRADQSAESEAVTADGDRDVGVSALDPRSDAGQERWLAFHRYVHDWWQPRQNDHGSIEPGIGSAMRERVGRCLAPIVREEFERECDLPRRGPQTKREGTPERAAQELFEGCSYLVNRHGQGRIRPEDMSEEFWRTDRLWAVQDSLDCEIVSPDDVSMTPSDRVRLILNEAIDDVDQLRTITDPDDERVRRFIYHLSLLFGHVVSHQASRNFSRSWAHAKQSGTVRWDVVVESVSNIAKDVRVASLPEYVDLYSWSLWRSYADTVSAVRERLKRFARDFEGCLEMPPAEGGRKHELLYAQAKDFAARAFGEEARQEIHHAVGRDKSSATPIARQIPGGGLSYRVAVFAQCLDQMTSRARIGGIRRGFRMLDADRR